MNTESSRAEARIWSRKSILMGVALLSTLSTQCGRSPVGTPSQSNGLHEVRVQGQRWGPGLLPPTRGEEEGQGGESKRERLERWIESRHRTAPGVDWSAIEAANLQAALARLAAKARGPQPVWRERGPVNMAGATALTGLRPDGRTLLIASLGGGIFSGIPGGKGWPRLTDSLAGYLEGFVVSSPPETWVAAVSTRNKNLVYVSRNQGASWSTPQGLPPLFRVYELLQDGGDRRTIYLLGSTPGEDDIVPVLARSRDGGLSFTVVFQGTSFDQPGLWTSRTGPGPLYLLSHGQLLVSTDQGSSFSPLGQIGRELNSAVLRGSEAGAPTLYAAVGKGSPSEELFASEDGGRTWEKRFTSTVSDYKVLGSSLVASPRNPDLVLFGFVDGWRSTDGGRNFTKINNWYDYYDDPARKLHADIRGLQFLFYRGKETLFLSTDGGTYTSTNGGASVNNIHLKGLMNAQIYSTWSSDSNPDLFLAGSQDQGLQRTIPPRGGRAGVPLSTVQWISGDYGNLTSASHDLSNVFAFYPGYLILLSPGGDSSSILSAPLPMTSGSFFAAAAADPDDPSTVYVAGDHIWKMRYLGGGEFAQAQLPQDFSRGGRDYVSALAIAPSDHDLWYAATFEGHLWYSRDRGATWTESAATRGTRPNNSISALLVSTDDPLTCFAGGSGYGSPPVLVTRDGGANWSPLSEGLPSTLVWSLAFDSPTTQTLYAATDAGPFVLDTASSTWQSLLGGGSPVVPYYSVEGVPSARLIRFGTFGRGVWDYVPPRPSQ